MTYIISQPCVDVKDRACVDECPVDCIYEGKRMLYIHPDECVDCGACEPVCPVEAIFYEDDTPEEWKEYYNATVDFFSDLGSPGDTNSAASAVTSGIEELEEVGGPHQLGRVGRNGELPGLAGGAERQGGCRCVPCRRCRSAHGG